MSSENNRKVIYSVIGGVALLGLSWLIYKKMSSAEAVQTGDYDELIAKIKALGTPTKDASGKITFEYIIKFAEIVGREGKVRLADMLEDSKV